MCEYCKLSDELMKEIDPILEKYAEQVELISNTTTVPINAQKKTILLFSAMSQVFARESLDHGIKLRHYFNCFKVGMLTEVLRYIIPMNEDSVLEKTSTDKASILKGIAETLLGEYGIHEVPAPDGNSHIPLSNFLPTVEIETTDSVEELARKIKKLAELASKASTPSTPNKSKEEEILKLFEAMETNDGTTKH